MVILEGCSFVFYKGTALTRIYSAELFTFIIITIFIQNPRKGTCPLQYIWRGLKWAVETGGCRESHAVRNKLRAVGRERGRYLHPPGPFTT